MRRKCKKLLRSILASVLVAVYLVPSSAYAAVVPGSNGTGDASIIHTEGSGLCEPGVLLYIDTVKNKVLKEPDSVREAITQKEKEYIADPGNSDNVWLDDVGYTVVGDHLIKYPDELADPSSSDLYERGILIVRDTGTDGKYEGRKIKTEIKHRFLNTSNMTDDKEIENIYVVPRTTSCSKTTFSLSLVSAQIKADSYVDDFYQNYPEQVTMDYINSYVSSHKKEMDAAVDEFLYHFQDSGTLAAHLKTLLKENPKVEESIAKENLLQYLDLLVLINYMSGGRNDDVVQVFLDEKNRNGAENFAVVFMGAVVSWGTNTDFTWLSFPVNMYAACSRNSLESYGSLTCSTFETADPLKQTNSKIEYSSANSKYAEEYWQALTNLEGVKTRLNSNEKHTRGANIARMWFTLAVGKKHYSLSDAYGTAFTLMPTDIFGNQKGALGYTYFSTAGIAHRIE